MTWLSPFSLPGSWFKGNLHTHSTQSDGANTPEQAAAWYRAHGYDLLAISDHWVFTPGVSTAGTGLLTLPAAEVNGPGYHLLALGLSKLPERSLENDPQALVHEIGRQGGLAYFAHPYWTGQTSAQIAQVEGLQGIEVYNATCDVVTGLGYSDVVWDELLSRGRRLNALAVDDAHWRHGEEGTGFVMVRAGRLDEASILMSLRQGRFYASTGPVITDLRVVNGADGGLALSVQCSPCRSIVFHAAGPLGRRISAPAGGLLTTASYPIRREQIYLRVACHDERGGTAWANPLFVADVLRAP